MNSQKKSSLPKQSSNLTCKICSIKCTSRSSLEQHYHGAQHKKKIQLMHSGIIGQLPSKNVMEKIFNKPGRKGALIGLQYLKAFTNKKHKPYYSCCLCGAGSTFANISEHICGNNHKINYILKSLPFVGREKLEQPNAPIEKIAESIEAAEGLTKFNEAFPNLQNTSACNSQDGSARQIRIDSLENCAGEGVHYNPQSKGNTLKRLESGLQLAEPLYKKRREHDEYNQISSNYNAPVSDLVASSSLDFSIHDSVCEKYPSLPVAKDAQAPSSMNMPCTTESFVSKNSGIQQGFNSDLRSVSPSIIPSVHWSFPSTLPGSCFYRNVAYDSDGFILHRNKHGSPDVNSLFITEAKDQSREWTPAHVKDVNILENICHSNPSIICSSGQCSTDNCSSQSSSSFFVGNSTSIEAFGSTSSVSPGSTSVLQELPFGTVSSGYTSINQVSSSPSVEVNHSSLSPDILKILRGKDVTAVNTILNELADHCPQLKKVNISMLVDVLFEAGALN
ncbi:uncharacterized protein LOC144784507 [Lissotriton helveticus]